FGFDSGVDVVVDGLDRLHTTATSHRRVMVVEVMGRHAGWIALHGGIAGGADIILIPEIPFDYDKIAGVIKAREAAGCLGTVVVVAEGARLRHGEQVKRDVEAGEFRLGGIGDMVAREIAKRTGKETRCCVLGHLQRGGAPTTLDRILATRFGVKAVQLANEKVVDAMFRDFDRANSPGAAVIVIKEGKPLFAKGYGLADLEKKIPCTTNTNFRLASVTKQFTAMAVLILVARGKLSLQDR